jgi:hypothetical protein
LPIQDTLQLRWGLQLVMACSGIHKDSVVQGTEGTSVPYILRNVLLGISLLTLVVRGMR